MTEEVTCAMLACGVICGEIEDIPQAVAVRSVGKSMQMTHVKVLNVVGFSSGRVCELTASFRCFCSISCTDCRSSVKSTSSTVAAFELAAAPLARLCRFAEGPGEGESLFRLCDGRSGVPVRST